MSRYSQELHEFALAVVLPCRDTLFRDFSYEYSLFFRVKEKELINSITDKSERTRMNTLRWIENDDARKRLDKEHHLFSSDEAALIAHNCSWLTIEEKHMLFGEIRATTTLSVILRPLSKRHGKPPHALSFLMTWISSPTRIATIVMRKNMWRFSPVLMR